MKKIDHWLDSFEIYHKKYIIIPSESLYSSLLEESLFITFWSPPGFINRENETRCYLNATIQLLYFNVIFRQFILNINVYTTMIGLDKNYLYFVHNYQEIMIRKELKNCFGEIYLGKKINFHSCIIYFGKSKDKLSDGCRWIWGVII